ncbi:MAG TPA: DUF4328 domain-containing protein [Bacteroidia bacterium]|nr:DUF4328 domain-containing protein [Bacteroidia bacterium]
MQTTSFYLPPHLYIRPNQQRARHAILLFRIVAVIQLFHAVIYLSLFLADKPHGNPTTTAILVVGSYSLLVVASQLALFVFYVLWMLRAYANLHRAGIALEYAEGWVVGAWFIPIMNLFVPYTIARETWMKTEAAFREEDFEGQKPSAVSNWWTTYIIAVIASVISWVFSRNSFIEVGFFFSFLTFLFLIFSAIAGARMVKKFGRIEEEMLTRASAKYNREIAAAGNDYLNQPYFVPPNLVQNPFSSTFQGGYGMLQPSGQYLVGEVVENKERANLLRLLCFLLLLFVFLYGAGYCYLWARPDPGIPGISLLHANLWVDRLLMIILPTFAVTVLVFMIWMRRSYNNLHNMNVTGLTFGPDMAIGGWIIPLANFYLPYAMLSEISRTLPLVLQENDAPPDPKTSRSLIIAWSFFILAGFAFMAHFKVEEETSFFAMLGSAFGIISLVYAIDMVKMMSRHEEDMFARIEERFGEKQAAELPEAVS